MLLQGDLSKMVCFMTFLTKVFVRPEHPMPPNVTLVRVAYNSRQRNEVELEWQVESQEEGGWTGFLLEHRWVSERQNKRSSSNDSQLQKEERAAASLEWYQSTIQDPGVRSYTVRGLTPTVTYQFRVTPINYRTTGNPSVAKTPGNLVKGVTFNFSGHDKTVSLFLTYHKFDTDCQQQQATCAYSVMLCYPLVIRPSSYDETGGLICVLRMSFAQTSSL